MLRLKFCAFLLEGGGSASIPNCGEGWGQLRASWRSKPDGALLIAVEFAALFS
jgi:hypothetical protein